MRIAVGAMAHETNTSFTTEAYSLDEALSKALEETGKPVIIADTGDNPTAGATENLSLVLKRLLERGMKDTLFTVVTDAKSRRKCVEAGVGETVPLSLGKVEASSREIPFHVEAQVIRLGKAKGIESAVVDINGVTAVITDERVAVYDLSFLDELKLDPNSYKLIIQKTGYLSKEYQKIAARKMFALTPGDTNEILSELPYEKVPRPIYPLDKGMEWEDTKGPF